MVGKKPLIITPEMIKQAESYASRGLTQQQIADALGMGESTLYEKLHAYPEFAEAIKRGKAKGIAHVANNLLRNVENGNAATQIFYLKCQAGWKETDVHEHQGKDGGAIKVETELKLNAQSLLSQAMDVITKDKEKLNDEISGEPNV